MLEDKKGLRQCVKLHDLGEVVILFVVFVVPGQQQSHILLRTLRTKDLKTREKLKNCMNKKQVGTSTYVCYFDKYFRGRTHQFYGDILWGGRTHQFDYDILWGERTQKFNCDSWLRWLNSCLISKVFDLCIIWEQSYSVYEE